MDSYTANIINSVIQGLIALGTISLALVALWGDWFMDKLGGPKLKIEPHDFFGNLAKFGDGTTGIYYHIKVINLSKRKWIPAKNVSILVKEIYIKGENGIFKEKRIIVPYHLTWSPKEFSPTFQTFKNEKICAICFIKEGANKVDLSLYWYPFNYEGLIGPQETARIKLEIEAENCVSENPYLVELSWDGTWTNNPDEMEKHFFINLL